MNSVLENVPPMFDAVAGELREVGIDGPALIERLERDARRRLDRSIERGRKLAGRRQAEPAGAEIPHGG
jgi:hypothetical protein